MLLSTIATFGFFDEVALLTQLPNVFTIPLGKKNRKQSIALLEQRVLCRVFWVYHFTLSGNFCYGSEIRHAIFWGINFGPGIFLGFDVCPHSIIPVT